MKRLAIFLAAFLFVFLPPEAVSSSPACAVSAVTIGESLACERELTATKQGVTFRPNVRGGRLIVSQWSVNGHAFVSGVNGNRRTFGRRGDVRVTETARGRYVVTARSVGAPVRVTFSWEVTG